MQIAMARLVLPLLAVPALVGAAKEGQLRSTVQNRANPIRKVVTLLQDMQSKVKAEGKKQEDLYEEFQCYCKNGDKDLAASIEAANNKIESLTASLKSATEKKAQTEADLKEHTKSRDEAKDTMAEATALRKKEAKAYGKFKSDSDTNLAALAKVSRRFRRAWANPFSSLLLQE
jgi:chromosome segregation ATPase